MDDLVKISSNLFKGFLSCWDELVEPNYPLSLIGTVMFVSRKLMEVEFSFSFRSFFENLNSHFYFPFILLRLLQLLQIVLCFTIWVVI